MIASLQKNALPLALVLLCAAAMYMVYRDMRRMETRMTQLGALVDSLLDRSGLDDDVFNMLDAVCPMPTAHATVVEEAPVHTEAAQEHIEVVEVHPEAAKAHTESPVIHVEEDEDMEADIMAAVKEAAAA